MLEALKEQVCRANRRLPAEGLVVLTWGNASGVDRAGGHMVIKPSGVAYDDLTVEQMVVVSLADGKVVEGDRKPSSDTPTHLALYRALETIGGIVHAHSLYATAWAQARQPIPPLGTTHADAFNGTVPCSRLLTVEEIRGAYEENTGAVIVEALSGTEALQMPAVLVADHGPFCWGADVGDAVDHAVVLEKVAQMASETLRVNPYPKPVSRELLGRHFGRKHGPGAYYGQG